MHMDDRLAVPVIATGLPMSWLEHHMPPHGCAARTLRFATAYMFKVESRTQVAPDIGPAVAVARVLVQEVMLRSISPVPHTLPL